MPGLPFTGSQPAPAHLLHEGLTLAFCSHLSFAAAAKSLQSCPTLCNPRDGSPPGSPVPGILQARTLEWVAISFSNAWKWKVKVKMLSRVRLSLLLIFLNVISSWFPDSKHLASDVIGSPALFLTLSVPTLLLSSTSHRSDVLTCFHWS